MTRCRPKSRRWLIFVEAPSDLRRRVARLINLKEWGALKTFVVEALETEVKKRERKEARSKKGKNRVD